MIDKSCMTSRIPLAAIPPPETLKSDIPKPNLKSSGNFLNFVLRSKVIVLIFLVTTVFPFNELELIPIPYIKCCLNK